MSRNALRILPLFFVLTTSVACEEMGTFEAANAIAETARSSRGIEATQEPIEVSTDFTIGGALEQAAEDLRDMWASQAPCNTVERDGNTVIVDWGELGDGCTYNGHTYAGITEITVDGTAEEELIVEHAWLGFHNEDVQVDGGATVTWSAREQTRSVFTEHTFSADGETVDVSGEHTFGVIDRGMAYTLDGKRSWTHDGKTWDLSVDGVDFRLIDPAPEAGTWTITDPQDRILSVAFDRLDENTIEAVVSGVRGGELVYHVKGYGEWERQDEGGIAAR